MKVGAVLIPENDKLVGIFTGRSAVSRVIAKDRNVATTRLADVMTAEPKTINSDKTFGYALPIMRRRLPP